MSPGDQRLLRSNSLVMQPSLVEITNHFHIDSVLEATSKLDDILLRIIICTCAALYLLIAMGFSILFKELQLEKSSYLTSKLILLKLANLGKNSTKTLLFVFFVMIFISLLKI
jgi:hypothetical protein